MNLPPTSLIIASRERPELLADTVESVLKGDEVPAEIVVVDQSRLPHPTLGKMTARGCEIRYLNVQSVGLSRGRNTGIAAARYHLLAVIDDDMYVDCGWLTHLVRALTEGGPQTVVSGQVRPHFGDQQAGFVPSTNEAEQPALYRGRVSQDALFAGNMAIHRAAFDAVGLFDERLGAGTTFAGAEDCDLGFRLLEAGFCIQYEPAAVVYHRAWRSDNDYLPLRWSYGLGRGAFYAKHFHWKDRYMQKRMWTDIKNHILAFPFHFPRHRLQAYGDLVLSWGLLVGAARWLAAERKQSASGIL
jgi:GT2 family glycosyltransferase